MPKYVKPVYVRREGGSLVLVLGGIKELQLIGIEPDDSFILSVEEWEDNKAKVISLVKAGKVKHEEKQ